MQSFSLKRKKPLVNQNLSVFSANQEQEEDEDVDWLTASKRNRCFQLEDGQSKSLRLRNEGTLLAESERWWEAIGRFNSAISFVKDDCTLYDMLAQAYIQVGEVQPALRSSLQSTVVDPKWWPGYQTYGRALMGVGLLEDARIAFQRAIHLAPNEEEVWTEDLQWCLELLMKQTELKNEQREEIEKLKPTNNRDQ